MARFTSSLLATLATLALVACLGGITSPTPITATPTATFRYQPAFGIDYTHPEQYLGQGEQSRISDPTVLDGLRTYESLLPM